VACFTRQARLIKPGQYNRVFLSRKRTKDKFFMLLHETGECNIARLGLAIAKKNVRKAVDRNRIKRLIRESFRNIRADLPAIDIVVMASREAATLNNRQILMCLNEHWLSLAKEYSHG
jgi:ribonuclease P protein component